MIRQHKTILLTAISKFRCSLLMKQRATVRLLIAKKEQFMSHLATPEFKKLFENYPLYSQENKSDPLVIAKLFDAYGSATWYITEYNPAENTAFAYVTGLAHDEWGYVSLTELESILLAREVPRIERDLYFETVKFSKLRLKIVS